MTKASKALYSSVASLITGGGAYGVYCASTVENETIEVAQADNVKPGLPEDKFEATVTPKEQLNKSPDPPIEKTILFQDSPWSDDNDKDEEGYTWRNRPIDKVIPSYKGNPLYIQSTEQFRADDPVRYRYLYDRPKQKQFGLEAAKEKLNVMMDYTMMISREHSPGGTAWILDYVLPDESKGEKYPTKFFMASDAHVVNVWGWDKSNPYNQELSKGKDRKITLTKEKVEHEESDFDRSKWGEAQYKYRHHWMWIQKDRRDVSKQVDKNPNLDSKYWQFTFEDPKLVYFPYNYLGEGTFADFAVFEVDFKDERVAKLFTRDFYGKYDRDKGIHKEKALNLFAEPLSKKYTNQQLLEEDVQVWMAGYPSKGMHHKATSNYNLGRQSASRLKYDYAGSIKTERGNACEQENQSNVLAKNNVRIKFCEDLLGHIDIAKWNRNVGKNRAPKLSWGDKSTDEIGYFYLLDDVEIGMGASGSVATTSDGDVLGVYVLYSEGGNWGMVWPIRGEAIKDHEGKTIISAHDFIEGVDGQMGSYKEQIQKYVLKSGKQTMLSKLRGWKPIS